MLPSDYLPKIASVCLLLLSLAGCGVLYDIFLRNRQSEADESACRSQYSGFKDPHEFNHCVYGCMSDTRAERSKWEDKNKWEKRREERTKIEQSERDKQIMDKVDKSLNKQK
jgi:hypothetical protein